MSLIVDYSLQASWHRINEVLDICLVKFLPCTEQCSLECLEVVPVLHRDHSIYFIKQILNWIETGALWRMIEDFNALFIQVLRYQLPLVLWVVIMHGNNNSSWKQENVSSPFHMRNAHPSCQ